MTCFYKGADAHQEPANKNIIDPVLYQQWQPVGTANFNNLAFNQNSFLRFIWSSVSWLFYCLSKGVLFIKSIKT